MWATKSPRKVMNPTASMKPATPASAGPRTMIRGRLSSLAVFRRGTVGQAYEKDRITILM
jgi:hypothetical protein